MLFGNSGGKDSAAVIAMAKEALGKDKVLGVAMPCNSASSDLEDAKLVADTFGIKMIEVDLTESFKSLKKAINLDLSEEALINMKPRLRMLTLYSIAQTMGYLVIGTGNLSEAMVRIHNKMGR